MTRTEYDRLSRLINQQVKLGKAAAAERQATLKADFEQQLDTRYYYDTDAIWNKAVQAVKKEVERAQVTIHKRCRELKIPGHFAPSLHCSWYDRGRNAVKEERTEMRRVAYTRLESLRHQACLAIERQGLEMQTELTAGTLDSSDAKTFLSRLPAIESLMPSMSLKELTLGANKTTNHGEE